MRIIAECRAADPTFKALPALQQSSRLQLLALTIVVVLLQRKALLKYIAGTGYAGCQKSNAQPRDHWLAHCPQASASFFDSSTCCFSALHIASAAAHAPSSHPPLLAVGQPHHRSRLCCCCKLLAVAGQHWTLLISTYLASEAQPDCCTQHQSTEAANRRCVPFQLCCAVAASAWRVICGTGNVCERSCMLCACSVRGSALHSLLAYRGVCGLPAWTSTAGPQCSPQGTDGACLIATAVPADDTSVHGCTGTAPLFACCLQPWPQPPPHPSVRRRSSTGLSTRQNPLLRP